MEAVSETNRRVFGTLWPSFNFFAMYAGLDHWTRAKGAPPAEQRRLMDRWLLSRTHSLIRDYRAAMDQFDPMRATRMLGEFIVDELSNWYIRRNRARFWKEKDLNDKYAAYDTLYSSLSVVASLLAPIAPMSADALFLGLNPNDPDCESIHLLDMPTADRSLIDVELEAQMTAVMAVVRLGRAARDQARLKIRQPLPRLIASGPDQRALAGLSDPELGAEVREELNVKALLLVDKSGEYCSVNIKPNLPVLGKQLGKQLQTVKALLQNLDEKAISAFEDTGELHLQLEGKPLILSGDALLVERTGKEGFAVAAEGGYMAALDTTLTPELVQEGLAREFINRIQNHRKKAGLSISTRIQLVVHGEPSLLNALKAHRERVAAEVLATQITIGEGKLPEGEFLETYDIDGSKVEVGLIPGTNLP
jgi:isoleucyl-tRNA synthetase